MGRSPSDTPTWVSLVTPKVVIMIDENLKIAVTGTIIVLVLFTFVKWWADPGCTGAVIKNAGRCPYAGQTLHREGDVFICKCPVGEKKP